MAVPQFRRLYELTSEALEMPSEQRIPYLREKAGDDSELFEKAMRLISADEDADADEDFLKTPEWNLRELLDDPPVAPKVERQTLAPGTVLCERYHIEEYLDRGGMGEVYKAFDSQLGETVALKTISPEVAGNATIIERFKKEVSQTRRIRHPNVCRVNELFHQEWPSGNVTWFLTMEFLSGKTLASLLAEGTPITPSDARNWCRQMAEALAAAHALDIIHRDFKPRNVMLVPDGGATRAVVMDFGISVDAQHSSSADPGEGTPSYMSPEQTSRAGVSFSSDQYALGLVMYEVLTHQRYREGADFSKLPRQWSGIVERCLAASPKSRWPSTKDVVAELQPGWSIRSIISAAAVIGAIVPAAAFILTGTRYRTVVEDLAPITSEMDFSGAPALSQSGDILVYASDRAEAGNRDIWIQNMRGGDPRRLTSEPMRDDVPSVSPDGQTVAFYSERPGNTGIYVISVSGGGERLLIKDGRDPQFSPDGQYLAYWTGTGDDIQLSAESYVYSLRAGQSRRIAEKFVDARSPVWDRSGKRLIFRGCRHSEPGSQCPEWWVADAEGSSEPVDTGWIQAAAKQGLEIFYGASVWIGQRVYFTARKDYEWNVWAADVESSSSFSRKFTAIGNTADASSVAISNENRLVYARQIGSLQMWEVFLKTGQTHKFTNTGWSDCAPFVSADERWLVYLRSRRGVWEVRLRDLTSGSEDVVFQSRIRSFSPVIAPDGRAIAFEQESPEKKRSVHVVDLASGTTKTVCDGCSRPSAWIPGTSSIVCTGPVNQKMVLLDTATGQRKDLFADPLPTGMLIDGVRLHPNTGLAAFAVTGAGGHRSIYVGQFESSSRTVRQIQRVTGEDSTFANPIWDVSGQTIYYLSDRDGWQCIWSQVINLGGGANGEPRPVNHFHNARFTPSLAPDRHVALAATKDRLYLNAGEATVSIWSGRLRDRLEWPWSR